MATRPGRGRRRSGGQASKAPTIVTGTTGAPVASARRKAPGRNGRSRPSGERPPPGKMTSGAPGLAFLDRKRPGPSHEQAESPDPEERFEGHVVEGPANGDRHQDGIHER